MNSENESSLQRTERLLREFGARHPVEPHFNSEQRNALERRMRDAEEAGSFDEPDVREHNDSDGD